MDKHNNAHRRNKLLLQVPLNAEQQETLKEVKKLRGISSNSALIRLLLGEEKRRLLVSGNK